MKWAEVPKIERIESVHLDQADKDIMNNWRNSFVQSVRQITIRQQSTKSKCGTLPLYVYGSDMSMPKLYTKGTICVVNLEEEILLAHLLEDVCQGQPDVLVLVYQIASNSLVAKSLKLQSITCTVLGKTIDISDSNFSGNEIKVNEAQYEEKFEERYLHYIDNDADDDEMTSNHS